MKEGYAYPRYYNAFFASLRRVFHEALAKAKSAWLGYWPMDQTTRGITVRSSADLSTIPPIWPKLWRRLQAFLREGKPLTEFIEFLARKNERIDILSEMNEVGLQDLVVVKGNKVKLLEPPENLRVRGKAGKRK